MKNQILHNPRCSKSRAALELLQQRELDIDVVDYQHSPPAKEELREILGLLNKKPLDIMRTGDELFKELGLSKDNGYSDEQWLDTLASHPKLLERPIVVYEGRAAIGRPLENVLAIL